MTLIERSVRLAVGESERARPLWERRSVFEGLEVQVVQDDTLRHSRFVDGEFDACEFSLGKFAVVKEASYPYIGLPIFPHRRFRHSYIYVSRSAGIRAPRDLEGKRVGVTSWMNTAAIWVRGALAHQYDVNLEAVTWVLGGATEQLGWEGASRFDIQSADDSDLEAMLVRGDLDALIVPTRPASFRQGHPNVARLFPEYRTEEEEYFRLTRVLPISHLVIIRSEDPQHDANLAEKMWAVWRQSYLLSVDYCKRPGHSNLLWYGWEQERQQEVLGADPWQYGIDVNERALRLFLEYSVEQQVIVRAPKVHELICRPRGDVSS